MSFIRETGFDYFFYNRHHISKWLILVMTCAGALTNCSCICAPCRIVGLYTGWRKKTSQTFACIIQPSSNESVQKHICNDQTSSNMCRNFRLKHFSIGRDTSKNIVTRIKPVSYTHLTLPTKRIV